MRSTRLSLSSTSLALGSLLLICAFVVAPVRSAYAGCITDGFNAGWKARIATLDAATTKNLPVNLASDFNSPQKAQGLLNMNGATDKFAELFPTNASFMNNILGFVGSTFASMLGTGGMLASNILSGIGSSGGGGCQQPPGTTPSDWRSYPGT